MSYKIKTHEPDPNQDRIDRIKKRYRFAADYWKEQHDQMAEDIKHLNPDTQMPDGMRDARQGKPTLAIDRLNASIRSIVNAQRQAKPAILVSAVSNVNVGVSEVLQGLIRHIEVRSTADTAYDEGMLHSVESGMGWWRIITEQPEDSFNQECRILPIMNPFSVLVDPLYTQPDMSDIRWAFVSTHMSREDYEEEYPNSNLASCSPDEFRNQFDEWIDTQDMSCMVCEYMWLQKEPYTLIETSTGLQMDREDWDRSKGKIVRSMKQTHDVCHWVKLNGIEILEEAVIPGSYIPVVAVLGNPLLINQKRMYSGLVRNSYEAQVALNCIRSAGLEMIATFNKVPIIGPDGFADSHPEDWAHPYDKAYLSYKPVSNEDGTPLPPPSRDLVEPPIQGLMQFGSSLEEDLRAINSMYSPDTRHQQSNDTSGEAIKQQVIQGDLSNFQYSDNLARAVRLTGKILIGMIPVCYSQKCVIRIIGLDDKTKLLTVNSEPGDQINTPDNMDEEEGVLKIYDLTVGKFDVTLSAGPAFASQREASRNLLWTLAAKDNALMQSAGDLIISMNDDPAMKPLAERLNKIIVTANPALADQKNTKQSLQQQLDQAHAVLKQVTQQLEQETQLADRVQADAQAKIQAEQMKQQSMLAREQMQEAHETAKIDFEANLQDLRAEQTRSHEMLMQIHKHLMAKDLAEHQAALTAITQPTPGSMEPSGAGAEVPPIGPQNQT